MDTLSEIDNLEKPDTDIKNLKAEKANQDDVIKYVITDRVIPNKSRLKALKNNFLIYSNLYKGIQEERNYKGLANLFIPETLKSIETLVSITHFGIFGNPVFLRYRGMETSDDISAQNMTDLTYYEMGENQFEVNWIDFERQFFTYGTAVGKVLWDFKERDVFVVNQETGQRERKLETYRDTWTFTPVDIFNFWIPPETPWYDIQKAEWLAETENVKESWIKEKIKNGWISKLKGQELLDSYENRTDYDSDTNFQEQRLQNSDINPSNGDKDKNKFLITNWYGLIPAKYVKDKDDDLEDDELVLGICIVGNDKTVLKLDKVINVFWHNMYPYVSSVFIPLSGQFFGMGVAQICEPLQKELNDTRNQTMDNKTAILMNMWILDKNAQIARKDLELRPNGVISTLNMDGIRPLAPPLFTGVGVSIEGVIKEDIRQSVSAISGLQGVPQPGVGSATEFQGLQNAAMSRNRMIIKTLAESALKPVFMISKFLNYQYYDHKKMIRIIGAKGIKTKFLSPNEITGSYDISLELSTDFEKNPNVLRQQLLTAFSQLASLSPQVMQFHWKLITRILMELGIKNPEEYYPSIVPIEDEVLLNTDEEHKVLLEAQLVHAQKGDDDIQHLQDHIEFRGRIHLAVPPYILANIDNHIKEHQASIAVKQQQAQMQIMNQLQSSMSPGQSPNSNTSTMQAPRSDMEIQKGVENG